MPGERIFKDEKAENKYKDEVKGFLTTIHLGNYQKEEVENYYLRVARITSNYRMEVARLKRALDNWDNKEKPTIVRMITANFKTKIELLESTTKAETDLNEWMELCEELDKIRTANRNFNKNLCFSNIRELLKDNPDVKIGQIEKEAGIRLGYMSRLEKGDNAAEPSVEFIVTAAKLLNVSVDTLISVDLANLTPTEKYLVNFVEKLKTDTMADKLNWNVVSKNEMDRYETDINGNSLHPLITSETVYDTCGGDYPQPFDVNMYVSKTFDLETDIYGDCYDLRMKNGSKLYLMNVAKTKKRTSDVQESVIEAVMFVPGAKRQVLATTNDDYPIGELLNNLYKVVKEHMKHPQVNKDAMYAINAFMNDDLSDDPDELPF